MHYKRILLLFLTLGLGAQGQVAGAALGSSVVQSLVNYKKSALTALAVGSAALLAKQLCATDYGAVTKAHSDYYWDWANIDTSNVSFDRSFLFGAGTSAYQTEGNCTNTDWHQWEQQTDEQGNARVQDKSGLACDHWNKYKQDVLLLKQIGAGVYRLSLAWDKMQPTEHQFDQAAVEHYKDVVHELHKHGIKVLIGFHHYTDPAWFAQKGGFEKEENVAYFVNFCTHVFQSFQDDQVDVDMWTIFNSPDGYAFHKYFIGDFPPGIKGDKQLTLTVLKNMCEAHVQVYHAAKKINPHAYIGLLKNVIQIDPWRPWHPMDNFAATIAAKMTDECQFSFFTTGNFKAKVPFDAAPCMVNVEHENVLAPRSFDFVGLNYYSHTYMKNMQKMAHPDEIQTDNPNYTIYPEGLYRAINVVSDRLCKPAQTVTGREVPVYVTENGIAHEDPQIRKQFFERYLYALHKAMQDGCNVKGYIYWSFMDNYEWGSYTKKYGLVHVDFNDPELKRTIKTDEGTSYLISHMQRAQNSAQ